MAECPSLAACPFFNEKMANMPATADRLKKRYCLDTFDKCARYQVSKGLGKDRVPITLFPHNIEQARELLATQH